MAWPILTNRVFEVGRRLARFVVAAKVDPGLQESDCDLVPSGLLLTGRIVIV